MFVVSGEWFLALQTLKRKVRRNGSGRFENREIVICQSKIFSQECLQQHRTLFLFQIWCKTYHSNFLCRSVYATTKQLKIFSEKTEEQRSIHRKKFNFLNVQCYETLETTNFECSNTQPGVNIRFFIPTTIFHQNIIICFDKLNTSKYSIFLKFGQSLETTKHYCTCKAGARTVGSCAHIIAALFWECLNNQKRSQQILVMDAFMNAFMENVSVMDIWQFDHLNQNFPNFCIIRIRKQPLKSSILVN